MWPEIPDAHKIITMKMSLGGGGAHLPLLEVPLFWGVLFALFQEQLQ